MRKRQLQCAAGLLATVGGLGAWWLSGVSTDSLSRSPGIPEAVDVDPAAIRLQDRIAHGEAVRFDPNVSVVHGPSATFAPLIAGSSRHVRYFSLEIGRSGAVRVLPVEAVSRIIPEREFVGGRLRRNAIATRRGVVRISARTGVPGSGVRFVDGEGFNLAIAQTAARSPR